MGTIVEAGPTTLSTPVQWPDRRTLFACGGFGLAAWLALDIGNVEWFPIQVLNEPVEGLVPHTPPIEIEGYGGEEIPGMQILDMNGDGKPMTQPEMDYLGVVMEKLGFSGGSVIVVLNPSLIHELDTAIRHIHEGADIQVVYNTLSPNSQFAFSSMWHELQAGKDVILSDKSGVTIRPVQRVELIDGPGIRH